MLVGGGGGLKKEKSLYFMYRAQIIHDCVPKLRGAIPQSS